MEYRLVLLWLVTFFALWLLGLPLAAVLLHRLPDRGAGVALPVSLTIVTVVVLWIGRVSFGWFTLAVGLVVLVALAAVAVRRSGVRPDWSIAAETFMVFIVGFLLVIAIRSVDPAVNPLGGEKFLDFGLLQSLLRAETLPPEDMWFAGEPVAYYYGGHLISALLTILTGTAPQYAYNLALAGFYAMLVTAAFGVGGALAAAQGASRRVGGLLAAFFVGIASNLHAPAQVLLWILPDGVAIPLAESVTSNPDRTARLLGGPDAFWYWDASRIIDGTINEFPFFAWLNGDLHAHMMGTPFLLLVTALLVAYYQTPEERLTQRRVLVFGAVPIVGGLLAIVETWAFPTVMGLSALVLLFAPSDPATLLPRRVITSLPFTSDSSEPWAKSEVRRTLTASVLGVCVLLVAAVWALPFLLGPASTRDIALFPGRSGFGELLVVHGAFVAVFTVFLVGRAQFVDRNQWLQVVIVAGGLLGISLVLDAAAVGLFAPLLVGAWVLLRRSAIRTDTSRSTPGFETVLLVAGAGLVLIVEFAFVDELAGPGRMNTVFKTYIQVWVLWGIAVGAMLATMLAESARRSAGRTQLPVRRATVAKVGVAILVVSTSLYGGLALANHFAHGGPTGDDATLNATQFVEVHHTEEAEAIRWIDDLDGQPTIVTAAPAGYRWQPAAGEGASAASSLTGVPTVLGWHHEIGYRGWEPYQERLDDVQLIYTGTPQEQAERLAKYEVEYVYVGPAERAKFGDVGFDGVDGVGEPLEFGQVLIYPVDAENVSA